MTAEASSPANAERKWDGAVIQAVWMKGAVVIGVDPREMRKDRCTAWMKWGHYGRADSQFGWVVGHVVPVGRGGSDELENLLPMHWENQASGASGSGECPVRANGDRNVRR